MSSTRRNDHIELLRAFAVLSVLLLHIQVAPYYHSGVEFLGFVYAELGLAVGVDLFLVISGYVITSSLLNMGANNENSKKRQIFSFWVRRAFRLLPSAWFWLAVALVFQLIKFAIDGSLAQLGREVLVIVIAMFNGLNIYAGYCIPGSTVEMCASSMLHGHYWSLSLEEQFYVLFPLLFFFIKRPVFIALLLSAIAAQFFWQRPVFTLYFFLKTEALCWGVLLAFFAQTTTHGTLKKYLENHRRFGVALLFLLLFALLLVAGQTWGVFTMKSYGVGLAALVSAAIVLLASLQFYTINYGNPVIKALLYVGSRSYAIYVIHLILFMAIGLSREWYDPGISGSGAQLFYDWALIALGVILTFILSEWNYRKIEGPWRAKGRLLSDRMLNS